MNGLLTPSDAEVAPEAPGPLASSVTAVFEAVRNGVIHSSPFLLHCPLPILNPADGALAYGTQALALQGCRSVIFAMSNRSMASFLRENHR